MNPTTLHIPREQSLLWCPVATHDHTERMMPPDFTTHTDRTPALIAAPQRTIVESMPWGRDRNKRPDGTNGTYLSFGEWVTSWYSPRWDSHSVGYLLHAQEIAASGKGLIIYIGSVRTELDETVGDWMIDYLSSTVRFCFDAAALEGPDSRTFRFMERHGGPERFLLEAHPKADATHTKGYPLLMYARDRRRVEANPSAYTPDDWHQINVVITGHKYGDKPRSFDQDRDDARRWARRGFVVGWMAHEAEQLGIAVAEVGK